MSEGITMKYVLTLLNSETVRERSEGLATIRNVFSNPRAVLDFDAKGDGKVWTPLFQALFSALLKEKSVYLKRGSGGSTAVLNRLSDTASIVRWLIERCVHRLSGQALRPIYVHLLQTMVHEAKLFAPVAPDYVKAIRCILEWTPHMEHLGDRQWVQILERGFNVVLGDPLRATMEDAVDDDDEGGASSMPSRGALQKSDSDENEDDADSRMAFTPNPAHSSKRRRRTSREAPRHNLPAASLVLRTQSVNLEQIEFMSIIKLLLQSPSAPLLSPGYRYLPSSVLNRLARFLQMYPGDSSLHHDYLHALSAALSHLALNKCRVVAQFARDSWDGLVGLWGTKNQRMKQDLVVILRMLFPYLTEAHLEEIGFQDADYGVGVARLWKLLDCEAESRWGIKGLSLDSLRLQVLQTCNDDAHTSTGAFVANTFQHGWHFDANQALAWAVLELYADCTEKIYHVVETSLPDTSRTTGKRIKLENPITSLLYSTRTQMESSIRCYHLQKLLFIVDRHWSILHDNLKQELISTLLQYISVEDGNTQCWAFLCLASVAHAISTLSLSSVSTSSDQGAVTATWDPIWTHAIRRISVPAVCRAASHAASVLLRHAKVLLSSQRVHAEIESLAKDLDVQGPTFPYDSVCSFLALSLQVASHDVRLYRLQLEEKALTWLVDNWRAEHSRRSRMPTHTLSDLLMLLEGICALTRRSDLVCGMQLPDCPVVDASIEYRRTAVIRDYLLRARLPSFNHNTVDPSVTLPLSSDNFHTQDETPRIIPLNLYDLEQPGGRERRVSSFLTKIMENSPFEREDNLKQMTAETCRSLLDLAFTALAFEALLVMNGTRPTRRVIQAACKLVNSVSPLLIDRRWTIEERALILAGLQPLLLQGEELDDGDPAWDAWVMPDEGAGIRQEVLSDLRAMYRRTKVQRSTDSRAVQRIILQSTDVQDTFSGLLFNLRELLTTAANDASRRTDEFGIPQNSDVLADRPSIKICILSLALIPILQSPSAELPRDKSLTSLVINSRPRSFFFVAGAYLDVVQRGFLKMNSSDLKGFLDKLDNLLREYYYNKSAQFTLFVIHFLNSTIEVWLQSDIAIGLVGDRIRGMWNWLCDLLDGRDQRMRWWRIRDCVVRFLDSYMSRDPLQKMWTIPQATDDTENRMNELNDQEDSDHQSDDGDRCLPDNVLPTMVADEDIRVRFRAAIANARLISVARRSGHDQSRIYVEAHKHLTTTLENYEDMLTRFLCLGNVMIVSSSLRRGPYWHLLEACLFTSMYARHVEHVLTGVSERLGLADFSRLFESYASQLAYSIRQVERDFLQFPPQLLGYQDRKRCAQAVFRAFTPTNLIAPGSPATMEHGQHLFERHCRAMHIPSSDGILQCFADVVAYHIVNWVDAHPDDFRNASQDIERLWTSIRNTETTHDFQTTLAQNADRVVAAILRTLRDQDISPSGPIHDGFRMVCLGVDVVQAFESLCKYRALDHFVSHEPNLPCYGTITVIRSLRWLREQVPESDGPATTYNVLQQMFADIERSSFVNEQLRLLNGVCVWVATHHEHFKDHTLLRVLINAAATMLRQSDMARAAQSVLEWGFTSYLQSSERNNRLLDILIRVSSLANSYASNPNDAVVSQMGCDLMHWLNSQALNLCQNTVLKVQVVKALAAWPQDLPDRLQTMRDAVTVQDLSTILSDPTVIANKFRLARSLCDVATKSAGPTDVPFMQSNFWRLKECISSETRLLDDDIDSFATLLIRHGGDLHNYGGLGMQTNPHGLQAYHRRASRSATPDGVDPAHRAIITTLLAKLDGTSAAQILVAYQTLRSLLSVLNLDVPTSRELFHDYRTDLRYLQAYPTECPNREPVDLARELKATHYLDLSRDYSSWISQFSTLLCDSLIADDLSYAPLVSMLGADLDFTEQILPILTHAVLKHERSRSKQKSELPYRQALSTYFVSVLSCAWTSLPCIRAIVGVFLHLRWFKPINLADALAYDSWLTPNYILLSENAVKCGAYTTALLFLELAAEYSQNASETASVTEQILFDIYSHIDEPDGFYGIRTTDLRRFLVERLHHEKQWDTAFRVHGAALEARSQNIADVQGMAQSLQSFGFHQLAKTSLGHASAESAGDNAASSMIYNLGWRTSTWDIPEQTQERNCDMSLYSALRAIHREREPHTIDTIIRSSLVEELKQLNELGNENLTEIREIARSMMCLRQIKHWRSEEIQSMLRSNSPDWDKWMVLAHIDPDLDFDDCEAIMATRISLIRARRHREQREAIGDMVTPLCQTLINIEQACLISLSEAARYACRPQIALNAVAQAQALEKQPSFTVFQEFSNVLWIMNEPKLAVQSLQNLLSKPNAAAVENELSRAAILARLGSWSSEASLEKPDDIATRYFDPAIAILKSSKTPVVDQAAIYHQYAIFAERQYHTIVNSADGLRWRLYVDRKTEEISQRRGQLRRTQMNTREYVELEKDLKKAHKVLEQDKIHFKEHNDARNNFLALAIEMYSWCLHSSDTFDDDSIIRLCSLWLANFDRADANVDFSAALNRVPSHKFVFLAHQLSARMSKIQSSQPHKDQNILQNLLTRMCREHPFHSLYQVFCLASEQSVAHASNSRRQSDRMESQAAQAERTAAAVELFAKLRADPSCQERVQAVERVCRACLEWAKYPLKKTPLSNGGAIPTSQSIRKLSNVPVPVSTARMPVDPSMQYKNCIWISRYEESFITAGGVNLPKITTCIGSDGNRYKQLFKGEGGDDLRQDAVMEQVFDLVNVMLRVDRETKKRNLKIRGYKVIPLASQAGLLEFVQNTTALAKWLDKAHKVYCNVDSNSVHKRLKTKQTELNFDRARVTEEFLQLRQTLKPVMRHYFTERHKDPTSWFAMRLNYARSAATTSIVGHILGLGDRHTSNILLDNSTGELVHIDLGIAFEQGKLLPQPERVPFRLTADVVDGLGMSGTQGVFQRCAEETLRVLRTQSEVILTILEVFKYDPLHSWAMSELKLKKVQQSKDQPPAEATAQMTAALRNVIGIDMTSGTAYEAADRALSTVKRKLDTKLSVEYTVNELIAEATDPGNLSLMYPGWAPLL